MQYISLNPDLCDNLRDQMQQNGWQITHQDVGQTELCGYGYIIKWQKDDAKVILNYEDHQGKAQANLELSPSARAEIDAYLLA
jgi:hypothetical protein